MSRSPRDNCLSVDREFFALAPTFRDLVSRGSSPPVALTRRAGETLCEQVLVINGSFRLPWMSMTGHQSSWIIQAYKRIQWKGNAPDSSDYFGSFHTEKIPQRVTRPLSPRGKTKGSDEG